MDEEIEYFEVRFANEADLKSARGALAVTAELGSGAVLVSADMMSEDEIRNAVASSGVAIPAISDSGLSEADMWPEWPGDSLDEEERPFALAR